jgi:short-chain fatty acids transporter
MVLKRMTNFLVKAVERYMPDPYLFAALLTFLVFVMAWVLTPTQPLEIVNLWSKGLWGLYTFTMQISIALVFSSAIVRTRPVRKLLTKLCKLAKTPAMAYAITAFAGGLFSLASWAMGLIVGGLVAKEMAKTVKNCHYPLLVAAGYSGFVIWHMGFTSSVALVIASPGHFLESTIGVVSNNQTILTPFNLITAVFLLFLGPVIMWMLRPKAEQGDVIKQIDPKLLVEPEVEIEDKKKFTFADKMEHAVWINWILGAMAAYGMYRLFSTGVGLTMESTNLTFLTIALFLNKNPKEFIENCTEGGKSLGPIVLQFPLYGGIMGMMVNTGLAAVIANWFVAISTVQTLPLWTFLSAGIINFFVPSGGSQWAVQGPIMMNAALQMGAPVGRVAMGVAWGDQWTNMIQPFWALPLLAIAGMKAKDIMGYCIVWLLISGVVFCLGITLLP